MYIIFNNDGSVFAQEQSNYVMQGSNKVNQVFVGFVDNQYERWSCSGFFTLPNSTTANIQATRENFDFRNKQYKGYVITLTDLITRYSGDLRLSINITNNETQILYTYPITIIVNQTGYPLDGYWDNAITIAQYNDYMAQLSQKADYEYVDNLFDSVEIDTSNLCTLDTDQEITGEKQFEKPVKFGINAGSAPSIATPSNKSVNLLIQTGQKASSITLEDAREYGQSAKGISFKTTVYEDGFHYGYAKMPTNDGSSEDNYYVIATTNDVKKLYDLIFDNIIVPVEETLSGVNLFIPSTFTLEDNLQHELIENTGLDIVEIKGNTWVKNQLFTGFDKYVYVNPNTSTKDITTTNKIQVSLTADSDSITLFTQPDAYNGKPFIVGHKYFISCKLTYPTAKTTRYIIGLNSGQSATYFENQTSGITTCTLNDEPLFVFYGTFNADDTFSVENLKVIDLTQMFGAGKEPTTIEEFNKLTANVNFDDYDSGTIINTSISELKSYGEYASVDLGSLNWQINSEGYFVNVGAIPHKDAINNTTKANLICSKYQTIAASERFTTIGIFSANANYFVITDTSYTDVATFKNSLNGVILYYEPSNPTDAELLETKFIAPPVVLNGIGTAQDSVKSGEKITRIGSVDLGSLSWVKSGDYWRYTEGLSNAKAPLTNNDIPNMICPNFKATSYNGLTISNNEIAMNTSKQLTIYDTSITQASDIKGVLYYELATPQVSENDLQLPQDIKFERNGVIATGSLTATDITINVNVKDWGK